MKKIIILLFFLLSFSSCINDLNTATGLKKGDKRFTETDYCIIVEECIGFDGLNDTIWKYKKVIPKDSIKQEILLTN
jgi:hypothetical protein